MAHWKFHPPAHLCCVQEAGDTREAFSALKAQFISHHDLLEVKERELVRQDGKVIDSLCSSLGAGTRNCTQPHHAYCCTLHKRDALFVIIAPLHHLPSCSPW